MSPLDIDFRNYPYLKVADDYRVGRYEKTRLSTFFVRNRRKNVAFLMYKHYLTANLRDVNSDFMAVRGRFSHPIVFKSY